jgi:hypothetical protein
MVKKIEEVIIPEDATAHKVAVKYVLNSETGEFIPESGHIFSSEPQTHRENVTAADSITPTVDKGVDCKGFSKCRFDVEVIGQNISSLKLGIIRWNSKVEAWFHDGGELQLMDGVGFGSSGGKISTIEDEAFGAIIFLWVLEFVGDFFNMNIYYILC